ncbi:MAG: hypothetical protein WB723_04205 [Candidatus Acidiferrales bacterium]
MPSLAKVEFTLRGVRVQGFPTLAAREEAIVGVSLWDPSPPAPVLVTFERDQLLHMGKIFVAYDAIEDMNADYVVGSPLNLFPVTLPTIWLCHVPARGSVASLIVDAPTSIYGIF